MIELVNQFKKRIKIKLSNDQIIFFLGLSTLIVALVSRITLIGHDNLDFDGYALMIDVEKSFSEYSKTLGQFMLPQRLHYWLTYRFIGGDLYNYRLSCVIVNCFTLIVIFCGVLKYFNTNIILPNIVVFFVLFNAHAIYLSEYTMISYSMALLLSVILFFIFLQLAIDLDAVIPALFVILIIVPAAIFSNLTTSIPVLSGALSAYVFRLISFKEARNFNGLKKYMMKIWSLFLIPIIHMAIYTIQPLTNMGREKRPDMDPFFFFPDIYGAGVINAVKFLWSRSKSLFSELVEPFNPILVICVIGFSVISIVIFKYHLHKHYPRSLQFFMVPDAIIFTSIFILITTSIISLGGVITIYPYGTIRYASYLLFPVLLIFGYSIHMLINICNFDNKYYTLKKIVLVIISTLILSTSIYLKYYEYINSHLNSAKLYQIISDINSANMDMILQGAQLGPAIRHLRPDIYFDPRSVDIGWGTFWGHGVDGGIPDYIRELQRQGKLNRILIILSSKDELVAKYPSYVKLLSENFILQHENNGSNIWCGYFLNRNLEGVIN